MTYRAGCFGSSPSIACDSPGCSARIVIDGLPPAWFLAGKPKRGWLMTIQEGRRGDWCPEHHHGKTRKGKP